MAGRALSSRSISDWARAVNPYGDGNACARIADAIEFSFGLRTERPEEFVVKN